MNKHVYLLGVLMIALGIYHLLGLFLSSGSLLSASFSVGHDYANPIGGILGSVVTGIIMVLVIPMMISGFGLVRHKHWARLLGIVVSFIFLLDIPVGTIIGAYGLWVLFHRQTADLLDHRHEATAGQEVIAP